MADSKRDSFTKRAREALAGGPTSEQEGDDEVPEPATQPSAGGASQDPNPKMPSLDRFLSDAQNKISEVIDAAERVAKDTHNDAQNQAEAYLEGRKKDADTLVANRRAELNEITSGMAQRIEDLRSEVDKISNEIAQSIERVKDLAHSTADPATAPEPRLSPTPDLQPVADEPEEAPAEAGAEAVSDDAGDADESDGGAGDSGTQNREHVVLRATQLAVAGTARGEIEATLVKEFGIDDAGSIVDEIVGPAS
jgi:archaellum component FlaC